LPISDCFWGDRYGWVRDPYGHIWALATVLEELTPEEVQRRMGDTMAKMAGTHREP
jgi:PhnB protein